MRRRFDEILAALRRDLGLTQAQVARRLGMTQSDVSKLERRKTRDCRHSSTPGPLGERLLVTFVGGEETREAHGATVRGSCANQATATASSFKVSLASRRDRRRAGRRG